MWCIMTYKMGLKRRSSTKHTKLTIYQYGQHNTRGWGGGGVPQGLRNPYPKPDKAQLHLATLNLSKDEKSLPYPNSLFSRNSVTITVQPKKIFLHIWQQLKHIFYNVSHQFRETYSRLNVSSNIIIDQFSRNDQTSLISIPWGRGLQLSF